MDNAEVKSVLPPLPAPATAPAMSGFSANVSSLLERVEYRRCESGEDLEAIYRLRYDAYRNNGDIPESACKLTTDKYDGLSNSYRFGVYVDGVLVSTVRVHHISLEMPFAPIMDIFGDVLMPRLRRGETFINPTMFAADPFNETAPRAIPYVTLRPAVIANTYFDTTSCVCVVRQDHTAFYRRIFGATQAGLPRAHPSFSVDVMLYDSVCALNMQPTLERFPFFNSTPGERRMMFAKPADGELAPLTILPTAKYRLAA